MPLRLTATIIITMKTFVTEIVIAASPARVWSVLADIDRWPEWTASVSRTQQLDNGPLGLNRRVRIEQPKLRPATWTITVWEPPLRFTWVSRHLGITVTGGHGIVETSHGCRVRLDIRFEGLLAGPVARLAGSVTRQYMTLEAEGLKARSEAKL